MKRGFTSAKKLGANLLPILGDDSSPPASVSTNPENPLRAPVDRTPPSTDAAQKPRRWANACLQVYLVHQQWRARCTEAVSRNAGAV